MKLFAGFFHYILGAVVAVAAFLGMSGSPLGGSDNAPPLNHATVQFENMFRVRGVLVMLCLVGVLAAMFAGIAHYLGTLAAVALFMAFLVSGLPKATYSLGVAATAARDTQTRQGDIITCDVAATTVIYQGTLVGVDASGNAVPASNTVGITVLGRAEQTVDNSAGLAGALTINIRRGAFKFTNSGTSALTKANIGTIAMVEDDQTVAIAASNSIKAGLMIALDTDGGVWIDTRHFLPVVGTVADNAVTTAKIAASQVTAAKLADAVADLIRTTTCAVANTGTPDGVGHVTGQVKDAQGNALAGRHLVQLFFSATSYGDPTDVGAVTALANSKVINVGTTDAVITLLTHTDGSWGAEYNLTVDGNLYAHATVLGLPVVANAAITGN